MTNLKDVQFTVTVDGIDISEYVVSMEFKAGLCNPVGLLDISVAPDIDKTIVPYEDVVVTLEGTKVFTGYSQTIVLARRPVVQNLGCEDALARVRDTWNFDMDWESKGETVGYWINRFLSITGVSYNASSGGPPAPLRQWGIINCYQAIVGLLKYENWQLSVDANGVLQVKSHQKNTDNAITIPSHSSWDRNLSDSWLRNRAIVLGFNEESTVVLDWYVEEIAGETRAAIIASPEIIWPATAYYLASLIQATFSTPWDTVTFDCPGNPFIRVGSTVFVRDEWEDHERYGLVTSCQWRVNEREGYVMALVLDERCPSFWVSDEEPGILYCATEGEGVWKTYNGGRNWFDISGEELSSGLASYVKDIHVSKGESLIGTDDTVWAATLGGIYRTETGANPWTNITEEYMNVRAQSIDWWGVRTGIIDTDRVFCLGNYSQGATPLYDDEGNITITLPARSTIYMYISYNGGLTWSSYLVNEYIPV